MKYLLVFTLITTPALAQNYNSQCYGNNCYGSDDRGDTFSTQTYRNGNNTNTYYNDSRGTNCNQQCYGGSCYTNCY